MAKRPPAKKRTPAKGPSPIIGTRGPREVKAAVAAAAKAEGRSASNWLLNLIVDKLRATGFLK